MKSIRILRLGGVVVLWLCSSVVLLGADESLILDYRELNQLDDTGIRVSQAGEYHVWVWARTGSSFQIRIGDREFRRENVGGGQVFSFLWMRLGQVTLLEGQPCPVMIETIAPRDATDTTPIGRLALSLRPGFHPNAGLELVSLDPVRPVNVMDARLRETRHTRASFDFPHYATAAEWAARREDIRRKILVSAGLWPMPEKAPLRVTVVDTLARDGYSMEKLYLQTWPGIYMPGTLYRPTRGSAPYPAVINPHGHGKSGRMGDGVQTRCANFALQGYIAFSYNMIGFVDHDRMSHDFRDERAELWSVNLGGLQLWNSIRAVDFITSLPEMDRNRIGCTGASGGGTQTFLLTAVDDRIQAAAPVCMVSSIFQGGCLCENPPGLRFDTYNVEIAACAAPRPQILVGATGDWTDLTPDVIYPDVHGIYRLTGDEDNLSYYYQDAGHNYNRNSREAVYRWFARHLRGHADSDTITEIETPIEPIGVLRVFDDEHPWPAGAHDLEGMVRSIRACMKKTLASAQPKSATDLPTFRRTMLPALGDVLNLSCPKLVDATLMPSRTTGRTRREDFIVTRYVLSRPGVGDQIPAVLFVPKGKTLKRTVNLIVHPRGKSTLVDLAAGKPLPMVAELLKRDCAVASIDSFLTGEHHGPFHEAKRERYGKHFATFNATDDCLRMQDILTAIAWLRQRNDVGAINLIGLDEAGLWCLMAGAFTSDVDAIAVDAVQFRHSDESAWLERLTIPGILRVGGFDTAVACAAPHRLLIYNAGDVFDTSRAENIYRMLDANENLLVEADRVSDADLLEWLTL